MGRPHGEARQIADALVQSLIARLGIIVERSPDELAFAHLSLQEFLAAETISLRAEEFQRDWISEHWSTAFGREVTLSWFGIQGALGRKEFASRTARSIMQQSASDPITSMRALELCAELATCDLGLPVRDAREFVREAFHEIRTSPFPEFRESLAKYIALGAIASSVSDECRENVRRMAPGRSEFFRSAIVEKLRFWSPDSELADTLLQALLDDNFRVRRASASTLSLLAWSNDDVKQRLSSLAIKDVRPEFRAAALHALRSNPKWLSTALAAGRSIPDPRSPELLLEAVFLRVIDVSHSVKDLESLFWIWETDSDYWLRQSLFECILLGWRGTSVLRTMLIKKHRHGERGDHEEVLTLLAESYPGDSEVADLIAGEFSQRIGIGISRDVLWPSLVRGFRGHPVLAPTLWTALLKKMEEEKRIFWHPSFTPAFIVVGTDAARDLLLKAYAETDDGLERYWIAKALIDGWQNDPVAERFLGDWWSQADPSLSSPLAQWINRFEPDPVRRRQWLLSRAKTARRDALGELVSQLLDHFPDDEVLAICEERLKDADVWYYRRVVLEAQLAAASPHTPFAESVFQRGLTELDGPPIEPLVAAAEHSAQWKRQVLDAAVPSAPGVRQAIASVFRDRVAPNTVLHTTIPKPLAEVSGPVRTTILCALARANRTGGDSKHAALVAELRSELSALGTYYESRRLSAVAALAELGEFAFAATAFTREGRGFGGLLSSLHPDPAAVQTLLSHLDALKSASDQSGQPLKLGKVCKTSLPLNWQTA